MDEKYTNHAVFKDLGTYGQFYEDISDRTIDFTTDGLQHPFSMETYAFTSISGTLHSVKDTLYKGRIGDAYALLRKYYESILLTTYITLYIKDNHNIDNMVVKEVDDWVSGAKEFPKKAKVKEYINRSEWLSKVNNFFDDAVYKQISDRCNSYMHFNRFRFMLFNDNKVHIEDRHKMLDQFEVDARNLFIRHFTFVVELNYHFFTTNDYVDYLEMDETPPENCQYWVATNVQEIFDGVIRKYRKDIATYIKEDSPLIFDLD
ncbi:MAG TPA: hypothetical protein VD884_13065 [Ohtaekwangia sp.]|nr:hypothetical protein [Ohtaekwangia sp.]